MKKPVIVIIILLAGCFVSCENSGEEKPFPEPVEIPLIEYSLENTSCHWKNLNYDESVIIINSNEELGNYIDNTESSYSEVDFFKNTLLLVSGYASGVGQANATAFFQSSAITYTLETTLMINSLAAVMIKWNVAVLVPKISDEINIILTIKLKTP